VVVVEQELLALLGHNGHGLVEQMQRLAAE
jgi:hypothetical protein